MHSQRIAEDIRVVAESCPAPEEFDLKQPVNAQGSKNFGSARQCSVSSHATCASESDLRSSFPLRVLHFGAGNIGRGFIGKLLAEAGGEVVFADVVGHVIDRLNSQKGYHVKVVGDEERIDYVRNVSGINSLTDDVGAQVAQCDLLTTAVGPNIIPRLAGNIADGIRRRYEAKTEDALNIICCENIVRATTRILKDAVLAKLDDKVKEWLPTHVGFVDCAVDRIVPPVDPKAASADCLEVTVETFHEWIVDSNQFVGELPKIPGMTPKENLDAFVERKLFTLNTGHAITAYLGYLKGYNTIDEAINDSEICESAVSAMRQSGAALIQKYHFDETEHEAYIQKLIGRFRNPYLRDEVVRVAREPLRKLSATDRLIKPLSSCLEFNLPYNALARGVAAALKYDYEGDEEAKKLSCMVAQKGVEAALTEATGLKDPKVVQEIVSAYEALPTRNSK